MDRRTALRSLGAAIVAPVATLVPRPRDPVSFPNPISADDPDAARLITAVYVDGEKLEHVYEFHTEEGWARYYDGWEREQRTVPRIRYGVVTYTTSAA